MPQGRRGDSLLDDIVGHRIDTFGPACDTLIREIAARLPSERAKELEDVIEPWHHKPAEADALFHRLAAFRASLDAERRAKRRPGRAILVALVAFILGGIGSGIAAGIAALAIGALAGASQFEGAFAMGVAAMMPVAGAFGGLILALWFGYRTWRG